MTEELTTPKKKPKKVSFTEQIRRLKSRITDEEERSSRYWNKCKELNDRFSLFEKYFNEKYFRIKYKMKANNGNVFEYIETHKAFFLQEAIYFLLQNKTHPDSFELIDVQVFG